MYKCWFVSHIKIILGCYTIIVNVSTNCRQWIIYMFICLNVYLFVCSIEIFNILTMTVIFICLICIIFLVFQTTHIHTHTLYLCIFTAIQYLTNVTCIYVPNFIKVLLDETLRALTLLPESPVFKDYLNNPEVPPLQMVLRAGW